MTTVLIVDSKTCETIQQVKNCLIVPSVSDVVILRNKPALKVESRLVDYVADTVQIYVSELA